jgi:hypothetical protein
MTALASGSRRRRSSILALGGELGLRAVHPVQAIEVFAVRDRQGMSDLNDFMNIL